MQTAPPSGKCFESILYAFQLFRRVTPRSQLLNVSAHFFHEGNRRNYPADSALSRTPASRSELFLRNEKRTSTSCVRKVTSSTANTLVKHRPRRAALLITCKSTWPRMRCKTALSPTTGAEKLWRSRSSCSLRDPAPGRFPLISGPCGPTV